MEVYLSAVQRILSNWTALKMSVEHGMASNKVARDFCEYIAEILLMNEKLDVDELEDEIRIRMDSEFNTHIEDNSEKEVSQLLYKLHSLRTTKDHANLAIFENQLPMAQPWLLNQNLERRTNTMEDSDSSSSTDSEEEIEDSKESSASTQMEVDPDGWSVVTNKKKKSSHK